MTEQMTTEQATNEALLRMVRKFRRMEPEVFNDIMRQLPREARDALGLAEAAADRVRDQHKPTPEGLTGLDWPAEPDYGDEE